MITTYENRNLKRGVLLLTVFLLAALVLCGCVKKNGRGDIASYAKKISGRSNLTVSERYTEIQEDEEGYLDHLWTVTDGDAGFEFHVLDDYYWALEKVENQLLNDYDSAAFLYLLEKGLIPSENGISLKKTTFSGMLQAELSCSFTDLAGLTKCFAELQDIRQAAEEAGFEGLDVPCTVKYQNPLRGAVDYDIDEGDTTEPMGSLDEEAFARMKKNYLACALDFRFEDVLAEFSQEEIDDVIHAPDTVRIYKNTASGEAAASSEGASEEPDPSAAGSAQAAGSIAESASSVSDASQEAAEASQETADRIYYEGVIGSPQYAGISFGTLYELLRQEGRNPEGNAWHFKCTGQDGAALEFSYDFNDLSGFNDSDGKLKKGYYYIRDGRKIRMGSFYANHFAASEIGVLTGLEVAEYRPYVSGK